MGVGGEYISTVVNINDLENGDFAEDEILLELINNASKRCIDLNITMMWEMSRDGGLRINTHYTKNRNVFKGSPDQIIPSFLVLWEQAKEMNLMPVAFHIPFLFEDQSGSIVFDDDEETLKIYNITNYGVNVGHWSLEYLNDRLEEDLNLDRGGPKLIKLMEVEK